MKPAKKTYVVLCLIVLIAVACGPMTAVPTATKIIVPTNTIAPTNTGLPEPSPTATLSQVERIFTLPTRQSELANTPTPIATPATESFSMRLRDLSEEDYLNLISAMNEYSYQHLPPLDGWWSEGQFSSAQGAVAVVIQEFLYHFSESPNADRLRWQLAFIDSIVGDYGVLGNPYGDRWILEELQNKLNRAEVPPEELETIIDKYWFDVNYLQPVENLFGDGKIAWFYVIRPQVWKEEESYGKTSDSFYRGGLFIVIQQINEGEFQLHLLENALSFSHGSGSLYEISDHNKNDIPEIALDIKFHGGSICGGNFKIFEWKDQSFIDLTREEIRISDCADYFEYSTVDGKPSISAHQFFTHPRLPSVYAWNGSYYEFSEYEYSNLVEKWLSARSNSEESAVIEEILSAENLKGLSPAHIDFLKYRLGIVYALQSQVSQAKVVLQDLVNNPSDKTRTVYSELAGNFLKYYSGEGSLYLTCKKSRERFDEISNSPSSQNDEELFGIPFDFTFGPGMLRCFDEDVLEVLVAKVPAVVENAPDELRKNGMNIDYAEKQDVNLDGLSEEWLIFIANSAFIVAPTGSYYEAVRINNFGSGEVVNNFPKPEIHIERWTGITEPVLTILANHELLVLSIGEDYSSTWLNSDYDVEDILLSPQGTPAQYQVFHVKPTEDTIYYDVPWKGYRWDPDRQIFRQDLIESILFTEQNPDKAVELANAVMPLLVDWQDFEDTRPWLPMDYYMCALSYELSGDAQKAAVIYWQLWRDFPDSHYARLAEFKLEPINP